MAQEQNNSENEEIVPLNAAELDPDQLEDVAGGVPPGGEPCGIFSCTTYND